MKVIPEILHANVQKWPERKALVATKGGDDVALSFSELEAAADAFAVLLVGRGIRRGDPVLVFVPMSLELYVGLLGIFRIGAVALFLDPSAGMAHIKACCEMLPPRALVGPWLLRWLKPFVPGVRSIPHIFTPPSLRGEPAQRQLPALPLPDDAALITFTSGSTGLPKAAVRSHRFLVSQYEALRDSIRLEEGEVDLTTLPVFVLANLAAGITSVLPDAKISHPGSVDAQRLSRQIARQRPGRTGGSPAFYQRLAAEPDSLKSFRKIYTGGAPVFPSLLQGLQTLVPEAEVVAVYGSTEAEPIAHVACSGIRDEDWQAMRDGRGLLAGHRVPQIRVRIVADQWGRALSSNDPLGSDETGEILVTGDHVLKGYLHGRGDEETKVRIDGEVWHRTGDAGRLDAEGRLWLAGRCAARIEDDRGVLYPFAVECVAMTYPEIRRAAFVRIAGRRLLVLEGSVSPEVVDELRGRLQWALIDEVRLLRQIPVDARHNAKVNYPKLFRMLGR